MTNKKSLYEILQVANDATYPEIQAAHERLVQTLESQRPVLSREDYSNQLRLLRVAFHTLSTPSSRDSYDAHLSIRSEPAKPAPLALAPMGPDLHGAATVRAEALLIRADAMALRAEAMGLKADLMTGQMQPGADAAPHPMIRQLLTSSRTVLLTLGTLVVIGMVFKAAFMFTRGAQPDPGVNPYAAADDRAFLQDYYQTWGVRPANRAEAEKMDAERRKNDDAKREQRQIEEAKAKAVRDEQRFEEESRRRGDQVSAELQYAEERAKQAAQQEDQQKAQEKEMKAEAERRRLEAERAKWQRVLGTSSSN